MRNSDGVRTGEFLRTEQPKRIGQLSNERRAKLRLKPKLRRWPGFDAVGLNSGSGLDISWPEFNIPWPEFNIRRPRFNIHWPGFKVDAVRPVNGTG